MKNIKAIKHIISDTIRGSGGINTFSRHIITASLAVMLAVQLSGCAMMFLARLSGSTYSAAEVYNITGLARGLFGSGYRILVLGFGSALAADIVFRSCGSE